MKTIKDTIKELKNNNGHFDYEDFLDDMHTYECAVKSLIKNKNYLLAYQTLKNYFDRFKEIESEPFFSYHPGMDYICSFYMLFSYAKMMEKGVDGVVKKNRSESDDAYLLLLKRFGQLPKSYKHVVIKKVKVLYKSAYPDLNDCYSDALQEAGLYLYSRRNYKMAFKLFKKGADFDCGGRQISYPYYLIGLNQNMVADMYRLGKGVKRNDTLARHYYRECAQNCGRRRHPKIGDYLLRQKKYSEAFLCYTENNPRYRYDTGFMMTDHIYDKLEIIFDGLNNRPVEKLSRLDKIVLAMMYCLGLGTEKNIDKYKELMPNDTDWVEDWMAGCQDFQLMLY